MRQPISKLDARALSLTPWYCTALYWQVLVDAVCLRRTKADRTSSGPLVPLPAKSELSGELLSLMVLDFGFCFAVEKSIERIVLWL